MKCHFLPSQRSASAFEPTSPTAMQNCVEVHEIPFRSPVLMFPARLPLFHPPWPRLHSSGDGPPGTKLAVPVAQHVVAVGQATPVM